MNKLREYLSGQLNETEMERFTKQIIIQKFDQEKRADWTKELQEKYGVDRNKSARVLPLRWAIGLTAAVAIAVGVFFIFPRAQAPEYQQLAVGYVETLPIMADQLVFRKGDFLEDEVRLKANNAYLDGNFETAIEQWNLLLQDQSATPYDRFYLGISYLRQATPAPARAIVLLEQVKPEVPALRQEINWVLGLAYLMEGTVNKAEPILSTIVEREEYMSSKAAELLDALEQEDIK